MTLDKRKWRCQNEREEDMMPCAVNCTLCGQHTEHERPLGRGSSVAILTGGSDTKPVNLEWALCVHPWMPKRHGAEHSTRFVKVRGGVAK